MRTNDVCLAYKITRWKLFEPDQAIKVTRVKETIPVCPQRPLKLFQFAKLSGLTPASSSNLQQNTR